MYYEINVAKRQPNGEYHHFFATNARSCTNTTAVKEVYKKLAEVFPEPEYKIDVTKWEEHGFGVDMKKMMKEE